MEDGVEVGGSEVLVEGAPAVEAVEEVHEAGQPEEVAEKPKLEMNEDGTLPKGVQKRIDRAVRRQYEAEAEAKVLRERLQQAERGREQAAPRRPEPEEPTIDKFSNFDEYVSAKAQYIASKQIQAVLQEREQQEQVKAVQREQATIAAKWQEQVRQTATELPDFEDTLAVSTAPMTAVMQEAIVHSEVGAKLAYWLAKNPAEAEKIASMHPVNQVRSLGRIEERLEKGSAAPTASAAVSNAPAPIKPVGVRASAAKDPDKMSTAEWLQWRNSQLKTKR